jgi:nicotinamide mononucleotide transporter
MSGIEWLAAVLGLANVWLIVRRSVLNYPFALVMCALYLFIFYEAKLYSDAGLQVFFIAINIYGWAAWARNSAEAGEVVVERLSDAERLIWAAGTLLLCALWGTGMAKLTDASYPYWDGSVAMISIVSQILMAQRRIENWIGWIIVNALSIPLYLTKGLYPTMVLYTILLGMAVIGWLQWKARVKT